MTAMIRLNRFATTTQTRRYRYTRWEMDEANTVCAAGGIEAPKRLDRPSAVMSSRRRLMAIHKKNG
ncbi:hypothetical protein M514_04331 [Trichuris suis]|uniref:Uncharacterized protein n=1 Tax=Trichuris suis TaxID=68888 RepID=A0A085MX32_9BILA|nr:hypothetical protein M513_04331 [Trichuris suis]KFD61778.1 hypothetical protein M514_04331 [Trichuris suis]